MKPSVLIGAPARRLAMLALLYLALMSACQAQAASATPAPPPIATQVQLVDTAFTRGAPIPGWVDTMTFMPGAQSRGPLTMRLADAYFYVDKETAVFAHRAMQANEASALAYIGQTEIAFHPDYQRVQLHRLRVHRAGQLLDKLAEADIRFLRREPELDSGIYGGAVTAAIVVNDVRIGDTLEIAYTITGKNPVFGRRFFDAATWDSTYPTALRRVTLNAPAERRIQYRLIGANPQSAPPATESVAAGRRIVRFEGADLPAVDLDNYVPSDYQALRWVQFSEFESWQQVAQWAESLFADTQAPGSLGEAMASARSAKNPRDAVARALGFVQNEIRYLSVSLGENSHRPYAPELVVSRRYGDCKDKSLLLVSMLRKLGLDAAPVLVSTHYRKGLEQMLPSPQLFNHAIVRTVLQGKTYFLDPTRLGQVGDLDRMGQVHAYAQVLVVAPDTNQLVAIAPPANDDMITNTRTEKVAVGKMDEPVLMSVQLQYAGADAEAMRTGLTQLNAAQIRKFYEGNIGKRYPDAVLQGEPRIRDEPGDNRISVDLQFRIRDFFQLAAGKWSLRYQPDNLRNLFYVPGSSNRNAPLAVPGFPSINRYQMEVSLPDEFDARYSPSQSTLRDPAFTLSESLAFSGKLLKVAMELKVSEDRVAVKDVATFMSDLNKASEIMQGTLYIKQTDLRASPANIASDLPFKQAVVERLERTIKSTTQVIADARLTGRDASTAQCERARAAAYLGRRSEASVDVQNAARQQPNAPGMLRCRAEIELITADFKASEQDFSRAMALGLVDSSIYLQRGIANYYLGRPAAAKDDFSKAQSQADSPIEKTRAGIWSLFALRRAGESTAAPAIDGASAEDEWPGAALSMLSNRQTPEAMLRVTHKESGDSLELALVEAYFYVGQQYLLAGDRLKARLYFQHSVDKGALYSQYHSAAQQELMRLK